MHARQLSHHCLTLAPYPYTNLSNLSRMQARKLKSILGGASASSKPKHCHSDPDPDPKHHSDTPPLSTRSMADAKMPMP